MKNILILGCSYSQGSYEHDGPYTGGDEESLILDSNGWYHYVDTLKSNIVTVIACPGNGYCFYSQILLCLENLEMIKLFDEVIIQESFEPRVCVVDNLILEWIIKNLLVISKNKNEFQRNIIIANYFDELKDDWEYYDRYVTDKMRIININGILLRPEYHQNKNLQKISTSTYNNHLSAMSKTLVDKICHNNNITCKVWPISYNSLNDEQWENQIKNYNYEFKNINKIESLYDFKKLKTLVPQPSLLKNNTSIASYLYWYAVESKLSNNMKREYHPNLEGNKMIGQILNKVM